MKTTARYLHLSRIGLIVVSAFSFVGRAVAQNPPAPADSPVVPAPDKSPYTLWNRTPLELRRPLYTDHGAVSPYTVDAGAVTAETSFGYGWSQRNSDMVQRTYESWNIGNTWLKAGILNNLDFEVGIPIWQERTETLRDSTGHDTQTRSRFVNDLYTQIKLNAWGNDGGPSALSFMGTMKWPTGPCDDYEGGLSALYTYRCPCGLESRFNSGFMLRRSDGGCWESCFDNRISLSHAIVGNLSALAAFNSQVSTSRRSNWDGSFETGLIYKATPDFQIYFGSGFGVTGNAKDFHPSLSLAFRY